MDRLPRGLRPHPPTRALLHRVPLRLVRRRQMGPHAKNERPMDQGCGAVNLGVITSCSLRPLTLNKSPDPKIPPKPTSSPSNYPVFRALCADTRTHATCTQAAEFNLLTRFLLR